MHININILSIFACPVVFSFHASPVPEEKYKGQVADACLQQERVAMDAHILKYIYLCKLVLYS
jgi:hypothetical protein